MAGEVLFGFHSLESLLDQRVENPTVLTAVNNALNDVLTEYNRQFDAIWGLLVTRTTDAQRRFEVAGDRVRLQALDEYGRPRPVITQKASYTVGWPLREAGTGFGWTWTNARRRTVREVNDQMALILNGDTQWLLDHALLALFNNTSYTFADEINGDLPIKPLANGDSDVYRMTGKVDPETDSHYLAQAAAISDTDDPFGTIVAELREHAEFSGEVVVIVSPSLEASVRGLTDFHVRPDANLRPSMTSEILTGAPPDVTMPGDWLGYHESGCWIAKWSEIPTGYLIAFATGGERAIAMREDDLSSMRGLIVAANTVDHPFYERWFYRKAGFASWNRTGALVMRIGNASYAPPTKYSNVHAN